MVQTPAVEKPSILESQKEEIILVVGRENIVGLIFSPLIFGFHEIDPFFP